MAFFFREENSAIEKYVRKKIALEFSRIFSANITPVDKSMQRAEPSNNKWKPQNNNISK